LTGATPPKRRKIARWRCSAVSRVARETIHKAEWIYQQRTSGARVRGRLLLCSSSPALNIWVAVGRSLEHETRTLLQSKIFASRYLHPSGLLTLASAAIGVTVCKLRNCYTSWWPKRGLHCSPKIRIPPHCCSFAFSSFDGLFPLLIVASRASVIRSSAHFAAMRAVSLLLFRYACTSVDLAHAHTNVILD
jgi:hypothetical protein